MLLVEIILLGIVVESESQHRNVSRLAHRHDDDDDDDKFRFLVVRATFLSRARARASRGNEDEENRPPTATILLFFSRSLERGITRNGNKRKRAKKRRRRPGRRLSFTLPRAYLSYIFPSFLALLYSLGRLYTTCDKV